MLMEKAYQLIKDDLITCRLAPGTMVTERELSERHQTGKTPIREALTILQREGFVRSLPRRGILVEPIHSIDIKHTYFIRMLVEPAAAAQAARNATPEEVERIEGLLQDAAPENHLGMALDPEQLRKHSEFHGALAELSGIPRLAALIRSLHDDVERFLNYNKQLGTMLRFGDSDHRLVDAIGEGDPEGAEEIARDSLALSQRKLIEAMLADHYPLSESHID
jgi:DNA-binding GntR family transcriptional regulator